MSVLNEVFGPDREIAWKQFAKETGATYIAGHHGDTDRIEITHRQWMIVIDMHITNVQLGTHTHTYSDCDTRVRAAFKTRDDLKFSISRKGILSSIGKLFGAQDIIVGDPEFDAAFIIKGNDEFKIQSLLSGTKIKTLISAQKKLHLEIIEDEGFWGDKLPEGMREIYYACDDVIADVAQLKSLYELLAEMLDQLTALGCIVPVGIDNK